MTPFLLEESKSVYPLLIWNTAIKRSLENINCRFSKRNGVIVDLGGGGGPLSDSINKENFEYIVVDKSLDSLKSSKCEHHKVLADITYLPMVSNSVDIAMTITCLQYVDHNSFFRESHRILADGGIIAVHENGLYNPFILFARLMQRCVGVFNWKVWQYRNTIIKYYDPRICPAGFEVVYSTSTCLTTPLLFGLETLGVPCNRKILLSLEKIDALLLKFSPLRRLAFLNIVHFRKISEVQELAL